MLGVFTDGLQFTGSSTFKETYVSFFGACWDDAMVDRRSASPLGMLWPEMDAAVVMSGGGAAAQWPERGDGWSLSRPDRPQAEVPPRLGNRLRPERNTNDDLSVRFSGARGASLFRREGSPLREHTAHEVRCGDLPPHVDHA